MSEVHQGHLITDTLVRLERAITTIGNTRLQAFGSSLAAYAVLRVLSENPELTLGRLSKRCHVTPQTMTRIARGLEERGLIARRPNPDNESAFSVSLTRDGHEAVARMRPEVASVNDTIESHLGTLDVAQLDDLLRNCARDLEAQITELRKQRK